MMCCRRCATWSSASLQSTRCMAPLPRIIGCSRRLSSPSVSPSADPFEQSRPRLAGWSGWCVCFGGCCGGKKRRKKKKEEEEKEEESGCGVEVRLLVGHGVVGPG